MISLVEIGRGVLEKKIFSFHQCVFAFSNYLPLGKGMALNIIKKLESPAPKDALCYVWLELAQWFLRRR